MVVVLRCQLQPVGGGSRSSVPAGGSVSSSEQFRAAHGEPQQAPPTLISPIFTPHLFAPTPLPVRSQPHGHPGPGLGSPTSL